MRLLTVALVAVVLVVGGADVVRAVTAPHRTTAVYQPPVLAGQEIWGACAGGFYARLGSTIVLTSSGHCTDPGTTAYAPDGVTVRGVFRSPARDATCPTPATPAPPRTWTTWSWPTIRSLGATSTWSTWARPATA